MSTFDKLRAEAASEQAKFESDLSKFAMTSAIEMAMRAVDPSAILIVISTSLLRASASIAKATGIITQDIFVDSAKAAYDSVVLDAGPVTVKEVTH